MFLAGSKTQKIGLYACIAISLGMVLYCFFYSTALRGGTDNIWHYNFSHYSWKHPLFFLDLWGKPIYTFLSSPFAQFGIEGSRVFNVLVGSCTAFLSYKILKKLGYELAFLAILFTIAAPVYISMMPTAMTEPLCSLVLVLSIYLIVIERFIWSAVILSFVFLVRSEAFIFLPIIAAYYYLKKQYMAIPFLLIGFIVFSIIGAVVFSDAFWLISKNPYQGENPYGTGSITHFIDRSDRIFGITQLVFYVLSLIFILIPRNGKNKIFSIEFILFFLSSIAFFLAHTIVYWKGIGNSIGLVRVMAVVSPLVSMFAIYSIQEVSRSIKVKEVFVLLFLIGIIVSVSYGPFRKRDIPILMSSFDETVRSSTDWFKSNSQEETVIYYFNPYVTVFLNLDPFDNSEAIERVPDTKQPGVGMERGQVLFWDSQFGPVEGHLPKQRIMDSGNFEVLNRFIAKDSAKVWTGDLYEMVIFRRK